MPDIYRKLLQADLGLKISDIGKMTDRQIFFYYFNDKDAEEDGPGRFPEPTCEDDVRAWCASVASSFNISPENFDVWVEKSVKVWHEEQAAKHGQNPGPI